MLHDQVPSLYLFRKGCSVNEYVMIVNSRVVEEQPAGRGGRRWGALGEHRDLTARLWGVGVGGGWVGGGEGLQEKDAWIQKQKSCSPQQLISNRHCSVWVVVVVFFISPDTNCLPVARRRKKRMPTICTLAHASRFEKRFVSLFVCFVCF